MATQPPTITIDDAVPGDQSDSVSVDAQPPTPRRTLPSSEMPSAPVSPMPETAFSEVPEPSEETKAALDEVTQQHRSPEVELETLYTAKVREPVSTESGISRQNVGAGNIKQPRMLIRKLSNLVSASEPLLPFSLGRFRRQRSSSSFADSTRSVSPAVTQIQPDEKEIPPGPPVDEDSTSGSEDELAISLTLPGKQSLEQLGPSSSVANAPSSQVASDHDVADGMEEEESTSEDELSMSLTGFDRKERNGVPVPSVTEFDNASQKAEREERGAQAEAKSDELDAASDETRVETDAMVEERKETVVSASVFDGRPDEMADHDTDRAYEPSDLDKDETRNKTERESEATDGGAERGRPSSTTKRKRKPRWSAGGIDKAYKPSKDESDEDNSAVEEQMTKRKRRRRSCKANLVELDPEPQPKKEEEEKRDDLAEPPAQIAEVDSKSQPPRRVSSRRGKVKDPTFKPDPTEGLSDELDVPTTRSGKKRRPISTGSKARREGPSSQRSNDADKSSTFDGSAGAATPPRDSSKQFEEPPEETAASLSVPGSPVNTESLSGSPGRRRSSRLAAKETTREPKEEEGEKVPTSSRKRRQSSVSTKGSATFAPAPSSTVSVGGDADISMEIVDAAASDENTDERRSAAKRQKKVKGEQQQQSRRKGFLSGVKRFFGSRP
jgi:hypothetical protein